MSKLSTKQLISKLQQAIVSDLNCTDEQIELIIKLRQSFETDEERAERIAKFNSMVNTCTNTTAQI